MSPNRKDAAGGATRRKGAATKLEDVSENFSVSTAPLAEDKERPVRVASRLADWLLEAEVDLKTILGALDRIGNEMYHAAKRLVLLAALVLGLFSAAITVFKAGHSELSPAPETIKNRCEKAPSLERL